MVERIVNAEGVGCVRLDGEIWTARAYDDDEIIEPGTRVHVLEIRGATALVERMREDRMTAALIALIVLAVFVFIVAAAGRADRAAGAGGDRGAPRALLADARARA